MMNLKRLSFHLKNYDRDSEGTFEVDDLQIDFEKDRNENTNKLEEPNLDSSQGGNSSSVRGVQDIIEAERNRINLLQEKLKTATREKSGRRRNSFTDMVSNMKDSFRNSKEEEPTKESYHRQSMIQLGSNHTDRRKSSIFSLGMSYLKSTFDEEAYIEDEPKKAPTPKREECIPPMEIEIVTREKKSRIKTSKSCPGPRRNSLKGRTISINKERFSRYA